MQSDDGDGQLNYVKAGDASPILRANPLMAPNMPGTMSRNNLVLINHLTTDEIRNQTWHDSA